jgi:general secretion pathway protein A
MNLVYEQYFGFTKAPFNITADPEFLFLSHSHRDGLTQLTYALKARRGFVVLTGEVGTGKTTLIYTLLNELDETMRTAFICSHISSPWTFCAMLVTSSGSRFRSATAVISMSISVC